MKSCYWCEIAGEESQHPDGEIGGTDADTGKWVCDDCVLSAWEGNSPTTGAVDVGKAQEGRDTGEGFSLLGNRPRN